MFHGPLNSDEYAWKVIFMRPRLTLWDAKVISGPEVVKLYLFCGKLYPRIDIYKFAIRDKMAPCLYRSNRDER